MKSYKIKSLIYLSCFILAAVFYNNYEQKAFQEQILSSEVSETKFEDSPEIKKEQSKEELTQNQ
ncbi:hypothetical protein [Croceitalea rosinachiae]|uniref:Secreted protein n=1 Tax=Croceitalea rosinachiae TaxID=3075596 RepID=A0ABU3A9M0_9FLAO|nr:hypothetical protein [Croceitalea sp. F388]MDT0606878.1 hypothetical protein [Croceitalea sp. F388]